jgi:hypothetical protein
VSRPHPTDLLAGALADEWYAEVEAAGKSAECDLADRLRFQQLAPVQRVLGELSPPDAEAPGAVAEQYGTLLFVLYQYRQAGQQSFTLRQAELERVAETAADVPPRLPHGISACYLQMPERVFWASIAQEFPPEPLDGVFVAATAERSELVVLAILGLRLEREGFSQITLDAVPGDFERARDLVRRPLFAPVLQGGERAGVKSLVSEAELLYLTSLALTVVGR